MHCVPRDAAMSQQAPQQASQHFSIRRVNEAVELLQQAVRRDTAAATRDDYASACALYRQGLQALKDAIRFETNDEVRKALAGQAKMYLERLQAIECELRRAARDDAASASASASASAATTSASEEPDSIFTSTKAFVAAMASETPNVAWDAVQGAEEAKQVLFETVELPRTHPQLYEGHPPWKAVLLFGPPGTGKTLVAMAAATAHKGKFFSITCADVMGKYVGESEKFVQTMFRAAIESAPCILFLDEVDMLLGKPGSGNSDHGVSERVRQQFLVEMNAVDALPLARRVLVVAATNHPWNLAPAALRRLDRRVYVPLPDESARESIISHRLRGVRNDLSPEDVAELARLTPRMSGSDLDTLCKEAFQGPVRNVLVATRWIVAPTACELSEATSAAAVVRCDADNETCEDGDVCGRCGSRRAAMRDFPPPAIQKRAVGMLDFRSAMKKVSPASSEQYVAKYRAWQESLATLN